LYFPESPGLNPTAKTAKTEKNLVFCIYRKCQTDKFFSSKTEKIQHRFFGAASWQESVVFFCKFFIGRQL
jgi:hypothetical protein